VSLSSFCKAGALLLARRRQSLTPNEGNFVVEEGGGKIKLIQSCESAGLSGTRKGDANYYLCGSDVAIHNNTEGKVLGPFIMASLEYEKYAKTISSSAKKRKCLFGRR